MAITEDGLSTDVKDGENVGRTLNHAAVVRELRDLGAAKEPEWKRTVSMKWNPEWKRGNSRVVVLAQQGDGRILGAASLKP